MTPAFPPRPIERLECLITAEQGYPALEKMAEEAERSLWLAFRVFDPSTKLRASTMVGATWQDLLRHKLRQGVSIRVLLADFDPLGATDLHAATWSSVRQLGDLADEGSLQVLPVRHDARVGRGLRFGFWIPVALALERQRRWMNSLPGRERAEAFSLRPGLWRYLRLRSGRVAWRLARLPRLFPASLHQKIAVADGSVAMIGGLDVDERRYDDPSHRRAAEQTWHDVSLIVGGQAAADISCHVADVWNANRLTMAALRREQRRRAPPGASGLLPTPVEPLLAENTPAMGEIEGGVRVVRTLSTMQRRSFFRLSPNTIVKEIEEETLKLIQEARTCLYIETQFLRSKTIAEALADAARRTPHMNLILVVPAAPEDIAFDGRLGLAERMGEQLQSECIRSVRETYGARAAILSPTRPVISTSSSRDALHGAPIIYVHAKVAIADDDRAIVGSANLNGRSMRWDTEAALLCVDRVHVGAMRQRLMAHWLGPNPKADLFELHQCAARWNVMAGGNVSKPQNERDGFLVPYDTRRASDAGATLPAVPNEMV